MTEGFTCSCCGEVHPGLPLDYGTDFPAYYHTVPEEERERRIDLEEEICVIDEEFFFIRGCLDIPIIDGEDDQVFTWGVWCSLSRASFERVLETWRNADRDNDPPYFGWLDTFLPYDPETISLKTNVRVRPIGLRPFVEVEPTDHPLAIEQREGITMKRVKEIAEMVLHGRKS